MNILLVDDEILLLEKLKRTVAAVAPDADLYAFSKAREALEFTQTTPIDIAFLDINMRILSGMELANQIQAIYPKVNIIFCTGYAEYALDAHDLHCSGYLLKPVSEEKVADALNNLRYPIGSGKDSEEPKKRVEIHCFGNFNVTIDGVPVHFKYEKTRELLAYLVDRQGALTSLAEIAAVLWEDEEHEYYLKSLRRDLILTLEEAGCSDILEKERGKLAILPEKISCDYYDWRSGKIPSSSYSGEYMAQYSWAEYMNGLLMEV
ncbi:MAG: response regulator [Oscillibacter sp.]|nr:response regulator [Oscillibacter sp.]